MNYRPAISPILLIAYGVSYMILIEYVWRHYLKINPFIDWLIELTKHGYEKTFWILLYLHDLTINTIVALFLAIPICWTVRRFTWRLALLAGLAALGYILLTTVNHFEAFRNVQFTTSNLIIGVCPVVIAYHLGQKITSGQFAH